jgi:hypothetical protein
MSIGKTETRRHAIKKEKLNMENIDWAYPFDWRLFEIACEAGVAQNKIAQAFALSHDTLNRMTKEKYGKTYDELACSLCCKGEMKLLSAQYEKSFNDDLNYNVTLLLHLGKVRLGQKDDSQTQKVTEEQLDTLQTVKEFFQGERDKNLNKEESNINNDTKS